MDTYDFIENLVAIICTTIVVSILIIRCTDNKGPVESIDEEVNPYENIIVKLPSFYSKTPKEGLYEALEFYNIDHKEIVYAQALLETGHFKSKVCKEYNNLFGLYDSKAKDYFKFNTWIDSVIAYSTMIQSKYTSGDYYEFLNNLGYAEDPEYTNKLKRIVEREFK